VTIRQLPASTPVAGDTWIDLDHLAPGRMVRDYELVGKLMGTGLHGTIWKAMAPGGVQATVQIARDLDEQNLKLDLGALELFLKLKLRHNSLAQLHFFLLIDKGGLVIDPRSLGKANAPRPSGLVVVSESFTKTLADRLSECQAAGQGGIPREELLGYMHQVADALDYLNARRHPLGESQQQVRILYRDVKPANVVLSDDGSAKLASTGLFMIVRGEKAPIPADSLAMTKEFAPPEFFQATMTDRSDQYSLALMYLYLRAGRLPFKEGLPLEDLIRIKERGKLDLRLLSAEPERAIIARAIAVNPADRYATCGELIQALDRALHPR
jgi:serine/threonine protein kinase